MRLPFADLEIYLQTNPVKHLFSHKKQYFSTPSQLYNNQQVTKQGSKRCLIGLQKGVIKALKEHLLQAKRALIQV